MIKNTVIFLLEKCENLFQCKDSHIFPAKNNCVYNIYMLDFNEMFTNNVAYFE